jgi:hypothetical protein
MLAPPDPPPLAASARAPRRRRSAKANALLVGVALFAVLCGAAVLQLRSHPAPVVAVESTPEATSGSASTFAPVELTATSETAVLVGTAPPGAVVRVLDRQAVADDTGGWRITVDLVPGVNHFQAVATDPSGLQVATNFTVIYTPRAATTVTTAAAPPSVGNATTTVAVNVSVTIKSPLDGAVVTKRQTTMSGTAAPGALVNAAGFLVTASNSGSWSAVVTLKPGSQRVTVTATTPAGATSTSITVRYNPPATTTSAPPTTTIPVDTEPPAP